VNQCLGKKTETYSKSHQLRESLKALNSLHKPYGKTLAAGFKTLQLCFWFTWVFIKPLV
jgi:hypothetical protein